MLRSAFLVCLFFVTACSSNSPPRTSVYEVTGSPTVRIANVSTIINKHKAPPTVMLDAHLIEEQIGDGMLGPSDFRTFSVIQVAPKDLFRWTQILSPLGAAAEYNEPIQSRDWWMTRETFAKLKFYKPDPLTGRANGWIGVSQQTGHIYIFTFTM